ncbi:hypothetical protein BDV3_003162 [Batrachochytrium dendrobatidis]
MIALTSFQRDGVQTIRDCRDAYLKYSATSDTNDGQGTALAMKSTLPDSCPPISVPSHSKRKLVCKPKTASLFNTGTNSSTSVSTSAKLTALPSLSMTSDWWDKDPANPTPAGGRVLKSLRPGMYTKLSSKFPRQASVVKKDINAIYVDTDEFSVSTEKDDPSMQSELVIHVSLFNPKRFTTKIASVKILGGQTLADLRDVLLCSSDLILIGNEAQNTQTRPGYFFIENTFYVDLRDNAVDCSRVIRSWMELDKESFGNTEIKAARMDETKLWQLSIELNQAYLYMHQGSCGHLMTFDQIGLFNPNVDSKYRKDYPISTPITNICMPKCHVCGVFYAKYATVDDLHTAETPSIWCLDCFNQFHLNPSGQPRYNVQLREIKAVST